MRVRISPFFQLVIPFIASVFFCFAQQGGPNHSDLEHSFESDDSFEFQTSAVDSLIAWQERIVLHVDKSSITDGNPIFFKAYALTGPNRFRATLSKVLRVELLNGEMEIVAKQYHKIKDGMSEGAIPIPRKLAQGIYTLRAYTRWMQNYGEAFYFTKELQLDAIERIPKKTKDPTPAYSISFHPEGGNLVVDLSNRLLIKLDANNNETADLKGEIVDGSNHNVADVVSFGPDFMSVIFTPKPGENYTFKIKNGASYPLPKILSSGYLLNVNNLDPSLLGIRIQAASEFANSKIWLKGELGGVTYFNKELELQGSSIEANVPMQGIPFGVLTLSLHDEADYQWAKRPIVINAKNNLKFNIKPTVHNAATNEITLKLFVTDLDGKPVATDVLLSAIHLTEEQERKKKMESIGFSWEADNQSNTSINSVRAERFIQDLEILTSDSDKEIPDQVLPHSIVYPFQQGLDLFGYAYNLNNELLKNTEIQMLGASETNVVAQVFKTDEFGRIRIENLQFVGETELVFRTAGEDTSSRLVKIIPVQDSFDKDHIPKSVLAFDKQKRKETTRTSPWEPVESEDLIELKEVEVTETKIDRKRAMPPVYGMEARPSRTVVQNIEKPKFLFQLLSQIPGIAVSGDLEFPSVNILRVAGSLSSQAPNSFGSVLDKPGPLWVIDGFIYGNATKIEAEMGLTSWDIDRIEFFIGAEAAMYGSRSAKGVFMIYTRNGSEFNYVNRKEGHLSFEGYFDSPTFNKHIEEVLKRPKRFQKEVTTIFWNPNIKTDKSGEATIRFRVPFDYKKLEIKASAVTENGSMGSAKVIF